MGIPSQDSAMELTALSRRCISIFHSRFAVKPWSVGLALVVLLGSQLICVSDLGAQTGTAAAPPPPRMGGTSGQTVAPVGPSGYKVPIP